MTPPDVPTGGEHKKVTKQDAMDDLMSIMSRPEIYAGEGFTAGDEIARPGDAGNGMEAGDEDYYPKRKRRR